MKLIKSESNVKAEVKKLLNQHKWFWWMPPANAYGRSGISDINAIRAGVFLVIETKFNGNKPSTMQKSFIQSVTAEGGFGFVVDEKTLDHLKIWLAAFDRSCELAAKGDKMSDEDGVLMLDAIKAMTEALV